MTADNTDTISARSDFFVACQALRLDDRMEHHRLRCAIVAGRYGTDSDRVIRGYRTETARLRVRRLLVHAIPGKSCPAGQLLAEAADLGSSDPVTDVTETVLLWAKHLGHSLEYIASEPLTVIRDVYHARLEALDAQDMSEERP